MGVYRSRLHEAPGTWVGGRDRRMLKRDLDGRESCRDMVAIGDERGGERGEVRGEERIRREEQDSSGRVTP